MPFLWMVFIIECTYTTILVLAKLIYLFCLWIVHYYVTSFKVVSNKFTYTFTVITELDLFILHYPRHCCSSKSPSSSRILVPEWTDERGYPSNPKHIIIPFNGGRSRAQSFAVRRSHSTIKEGYHAFALI